MREVFTCGVVVNVAMRESGGCSLYSSSGHAHRSPVYCFSVYAEDPETPAGLELLSNLEPLYVTYLGVATFRHVSCE